MFGKHDPCHKSRSFKIYSSIGLWNRLISIHRSGCNYWRLCMVHVNLGTSGMLHSKTPTTSIFLWLLLVITLPWTGQWAVVVSGFLVEYIFITSSEQGIIGWKKRDNSKRNFLKEEYEHLPCNVTEFRVYVGMNGVFKQGQHQYIKRLE